MSGSGENAHQATVLIVDDIAANRNVLSETLETENYEVLLAPHGESGIKVARKGQPDVILLDVMMPGIDGFETCRRLKADDATAHIPVIFISARDEVQATVEGFRAGGVDYLTKPFQAEEVLVRVKTHLTNARLTHALQRANEELRAEIARREQAEAARDQAGGQLGVLEERETRRWGVPGMIGRSETFKDILASIERLHPFSSASVLVTGESGTGKELVARAIHHGGAKKQAPFIPVNCSAVPKDLAESLFFGHKKGAFTGADADRKGYFELADGGTLFLDEVGEMPAGLQAKLLRVLEDGVVCPLGAAGERRVQIRVVAASNVDFQEAIAAGRFRKDLFFRLARFSIEVPPLRERRSDIPVLADHFLTLFAEEVNVGKPVVAPAAMERLKRYAYPGNVRELKNLLERAVIECGPTGRIEEAHLHFFGDEFTTGADLEEAELEEAVEGLGDEDAVIAYLRQHGLINNTVCRQLLGVDRNRSSYLLRKLEKQGKLASEGQGRWAQYRLRDGME